MRCEQPTQRPSALTTSGYTKFDSHAHVIGPKGPYCQAAKMLGIDAALNLSYSGFRQPEEIAEYEKGLLTETRECGERFRFASAFNITRFQEPDYVGEVLQKLDKDVRVHGAVAVKIWKDLGMMLRDAEGKYVFCDDERFRPIFDWIDRHRLIIYMHLADPLAAWLPLDPSSPHYGYYKNHPEYHWHGKNDKPSHEEILHHRDTLMNRYPRTRFVAAHLASLEHDLGRVADFLERFPNAWVDTAARVADLRRKPSASVREFFINYQNRILFGSDWEYDGERYRTEPEQESRRVHEAMRLLISEFNYFEEELDLPGAVLRKIYYENAAELFTATKQPIPY